jgi:CheY-like chemotaxis protein
MKRTFTPRKSKRILIVSDDLASASLYRERLENEQFRVEIASDGQRTLRIIEIDPVDLVIIDISKWGIHGVKTIQSIRALPSPRAVRVIVLANHFFGRQLEAAEDAGADQCVTKTDCTPGQLVTIVRAAFAGGSPGSIRPSPLVVAENGVGATKAENQIESNFEAKVAQAFFQEAPAAIARLRGGHRTLSQDHTEGEQLAEFSEMHRQAGVLASSAGLAGFRKIAQLASALEVFLLQLSEGSAKIGPAITRPIAQAIDLAAALLDKAATSGPDTTAPPKILVVESETGATETIGNALAQAGLAAERLDTDGSAADLLAQEHFDLVFIDLEMPGMDGFSLCINNRKQPLNRFTPVVFVTAHADLPSRARCTLSGGSDLIAKPFVSAGLAVAALIWLFKERPICPLLAASTRASADSQPVAPAVDPLGRGILQPSENGRDSFARASTG